MSSLTHPDWSREASQRWSPSAGLLKAHRDHAQLGDRSGWWATIKRRFCVVKHRFWSAVAGADIPLGTSIGGGLRLPHPQGVVIHSQAKIGINCLIMQGVTIGTNVGPGAPELGPGCDVGPGAKLLGAIKIGRRAMIGANPVVTKDVPDLALAVGVPAQIHQVWNDRRAVFDGQPHPSNHAENG